MKENKLEMINEKEIAKLAHCMSALSNEKRLKILLLLSEKEMNVSEIANKLKLPQSSVSLQLGKLANCNWIERKREGKNVYYKMHRDTKEIIRKFINHFNKIL